MIKGLRDVTTFLTIIPLKTDKLSVVRGSKNVQFFPLIGWITGLLTVSIAFLFQPFSNLAIAFIAITFGILFQRGIHLDGLMDIGDALMCHGNQENKKKALKDSSVGSGGIILALTIIGLSIFTLASLNNFTDILKLILVSEVLSKLSVVSIILTSKPLGNGLGSLFIKNSKNWQIIFASFFLIPFFFFIEAKNVAIIIITVLILSQISSKLIESNLGGLNGDGIGAVNELSKMFTIILGVLLI